MILLLVEITALVFWVVIPIYAFRQGRRRGITYRRTRCVGWGVFVFSILAMAGNVGRPAPVRFSAEWGGALTGILLPILIADALLLLSIAPRRDPK
jgi:hypothetical protein